MKYKSQGKLHLIIICSDVLRGDGEEKEYLVKWKELPYDECYWEFESDISSFLHEIERFHVVQSRRKKSSSKQKGRPIETTESNKKAKEFQQYESSPEFLSGGIYGTIFN